MIPELCIEDDIRDTTAEELFKYTGAVEELTTVVLEPVIGLTEALA